MNQNRHPCQGRTANHCYAVPAEFVDMLETAMANEAGAIEFYMGLASIAPRPEYRETLETIAADERKHLQSFRALYCQLTCSYPQVRPAVETAPDFAAGITMAIKDELEAYEMYRDMLLMVCQQEYRDVMFEAMTDEMEHAVYLTNIRFSL